MNSSFRLLAIAGFLSCGLVNAATPASGTLTTTSGTLTYTAGPFAVANPQAQAFSGPVCSPLPTDPCDKYLLTVNLPADYATQNPNDTVKITVGWDVPGADFDIYVYKGNVATTDGGAAYKDAASSANPEVVILPVENGSNVYTVMSVPFAPAGASISATIELVPGEAAPPPPVPLTGAPRIVTLQSPPGLGDSAGEPSIGYNLKTKRAMYIASLQTLKVTPAESSGILDAEAKPLPMSCPAKWDDVSDLTTSATSLDPILFTDQTLGDTGPGRTFVSQLTGANSAFAFSDDDGATWTPGQVGASNGGVDHQTVGSGPYPATSTTFPVVPPGNPGYAVYYCSQSIVDAFCARSDTGGQTFNNGQPIGKATDLGCGTGDIGGLHGHVRIAQDGTLAMPMKGCGANQAAIISADAGITYSARKIPGTSPGNTDPQLAWSKPDAQGKIHGYMCMSDGDGKPKAAVTTDKGVTWSTPYDLGVEHGIKANVFAQAIAGDADRAACAFVGTSTDGNPDATDFEGVWYGYVSYTFDGGASWHTYNVTPNDPVQGKGGICTAGTTCGSNRNLLDFNEITLDERGRVWFGYADGCTSAACISSAGASNDFGNKATIARQIGGRTLYSAFDAQLSTVPQPPCLSGTRDASHASLSWVEPDDGGKPITGYKIFRADGITGPFVQLGAVSGKTAFDDLTADSEVASYFYKVVPTYDGGDGLFSNLLELTIDIAESACLSPGLTVLTDPANDQLDQVPAHDVRSASVVQPYSPVDDYKLVFHLKITSLNPLTENTVWPLNFCAPSFPCLNPDTNVAPYSATNKYFTVEMTTVAPASSVAPVFQLRAPTAAGTTTASRTVIALATADGSGYTADGLITFVVNASDLGLAKSARGTDKLNKFQSRIATNVVVATQTPDNMPDGLAGMGEFATVGPFVCAPNTAPVANLSVSQSSGLAPLTVQFTGIGTDADVIDTVATFSLTFGDDTTPVAQDNGNFGSHTYTAYGNYPARLFVVDSRGKRSGNTAEKVIVVYGLPVADAGDDVNVDEGDPVSLSGVRSDAANAGSPTFGWTQISGVPVQNFTGATTATPSFVAPEVCTDPDLGFRLTLTTLAGTDTDEVTVTVDHPVAPPTVDAGADQQVEALTAVSLVSTATHDACATITYAWSQGTGGPRVNLSGANTRTLSFTPPESEQDVTLTFLLTVTDSHDNVVTDTIKVTVTGVGLTGNTKVLGGALSLLSLFGLAGMAAIGRKRIR